MAYLRDLRDFYLFLTVKDRIISCKNAFVNTFFYFLSIFYLFFHFIISFPNFISFCRNIQNHVWSSWVNSSVAYDRSNASQNSRTRKFASRAPVQPSAQNLPRHPTDQAGTGGDKFLMFKLTVVFPQKYYRSHGLQSQSPRLPHR